MRATPFLLAVATSLVCAPSATFALSQPNGAPIPSPMGCDGGHPTGLAAEFACVCDAPGVCNIGAPCSGPMSCDDGKHAVCETTLWHSYNDNTCIPSNLSGLDPEKDASVTPETFQPTCALTFRVITRGTAIFRDAFGWYNVTGQKPDPSDLHVMLGCDAQPGTETVLDIQSHPDYRGGEIGFFLVTPESLSSPKTCAGGDCCATVARAMAGQGQIYYSQRAFNPDAAGQSSFIHLVIYDSKITPSKFYFAWEDIYGGSNNDFTDLVTSVEGVECSGGGGECDTGASGMCAFGIKVCDGGELGCQPLFDPAHESCDALDNDCDGDVDEGAQCPDGNVCHDGQCLPHCGTNPEFKCGGVKVCDEASGLCVDPGCEGMDCPAGERCIDGRCTAICAGVVCPHGQTCLGDECVDLCAGKSCGPGQVCKNGACLPGCQSCGGLACTGGLVCQPDTGDCADPSCPNGCPAGTHCSAGDCVDACEGAVCPGDQVCHDGNCVDPGAVDPPGGTTGDDPAGGADGELEQGCGCHPARRTGGPDAGALLLLTPLWLFRRRR